MGQILTRDGMALAERAVMYTRKMRLLHGVAPWAIAFLAQASCGGPCSEPACPATYLVLGGVSVNGAADAGAPSGVEATLSGPQSGMMSCAPNGSSTLCTWPSGSAVTAGTYSLEVMAPGFKPATVSVKVTVTPAPRCGCPGATIQPSTVTLDPS
jgi:hypothetical protein